MATIKTDREVHGGPGKPVYAYAIEDLRKSSLANASSTVSLARTLSEGTKVNDALVESAGRSGALFLRSQNRESLTDVLEPG
ncbi:MOSC domain-containing protein [bacterium]|nr:MOSC domain-containing protein [bacterium]